MEVLSKEELKKYLDKHLFDDETLEILTKPNGNKTTIEVLVTDTNTIMSTGNIISQTVPFVFALNDENIITMIQHPYKYATQGNKDLIIHIVELVGKKIKL